MLPLITSRSTNDTESTSSSQTGTVEQDLVALSARMFQGVNAVRDPYTDGTLTLNRSGLRFTDHPGHTVFNYLSQDIQHITVGITRMVIHPINRSKFVVSLNAAATVQEVSDEKAIGYASIGGSLTGVASEGAAVGFGAGKVADLNTLGKTVDQAAWAKRLKSLGYRVTNLDFKAQMILGGVIALAASTVLTVLVTLLSSPK